MRYATTRMKRKSKKDVNGFVAKFYYCKFHKENLVDDLVANEVAPREKLEKMSLPLIYLTYTKECEDWLEEELEAIYLNEGRLL